MSEWQPVETAPKGLILLYFPPTDGRMKMGAMIQIDHYPVTYPRKPTHWMPLPEPPK